MPSGELSERNEPAPSGGPKVNRRVENEVGNGRKLVRSGAPESPRKQGLPRSSASCSSALSFKTVSEKGSNQLIKKKIMGQP